MTPERQEVAVSGMIRLRQGYCRTGETEISRGTPRFGKLRVFKEKVGPHHGRSKAMDGLPSIARRAKDGARSRT